MKRTIILAVATASLFTAGLVGTATPASAAETDAAAHTICLINQDGSTGPQKGLCITLPLG